VSLLKIVAGVGGILLFWATFQLPSGSGDVASRQILSISEEPDRIVLGWSGPVQEPMSERVAAAFDRYKADRRRLVLILNSPGGSIEHGRKVVAAIRARDRAIDTLVQKAGVCASMCVPIFLAGAKDRRFCLPNTRFLLHQPAGGTRGMAADIEIEAKEILRMRERLVRIISEETGQPIERINKDIHRNHWMTADEAIEYGMVARVIRDPRDIPRD